ncbi:unnamed protein product [Camellia sinensis]
MASAFTLFFSLEPHHHHHHHHHLRRRGHHRRLFSTTPFKPRHHNFTLSFSTSHSSSSSSSSSTSTSTATSSFTHQDPLHTTRTLTDEDLHKLQFLENFNYHQELKSGSMWVRVMKPHEIDIVVALLSESFAESIMFLAGYETLLGLLVKPYLIERRALIPHTATLIGFYRESDDDDDDDDMQIAGTVEICFDRMGSNSYTPSPNPPKDSPYVCNMTVKKTLRRTVRGIGWHLLKASEQLISQMSSSREVYLHCRMIDAAPLNMYAKAGYSIVQTDSILILLTLQRRKHLMCQELPILDSPSDISASNEELPS